MRLILSSYCKSLTGSFGKGFGYIIQSRRTSNGTIFSTRRTSRRLQGEPDPRHMLFLHQCATMAQDGILIANISLTIPELCAAFLEMVSHLDWSDLTPEEQSLMIAQWRDIACTQNGISEERQAAPELYLNAQEFLNIYRYLKRKGWWE